MTIHRSWLRRWHRLATLVAVLALIVSSSGVATATLNGSTFNAADGNLVVSGGETDWANVPNLKVGRDKPTGATDDSFGQGTDEDDPIPSVTDGSIPPNKSDLTRFYVANEKVSGKDFLYLAWERVQDPSGTTNMDFEFNQSSTLSSNGVTPVRTAGDILIKYDLSNGGTTPSLGYHVWKTTANQPGTNASCEASSKLPCWDAVHSLSGANFEGAVNAAVVSDPIPPDAPRSLSVRTFGEAAINLTDSGIFPAGQCTSFGRAYLKSRSSDSFNSAIKDFIAPTSVNVNNCGGIKIRKETVPDGATGSFGFSATNGLDSPFSLSDNGLKDFGSQVQAGSYTVTETDPSPAFALTDISCTMSQGTTATTNAANRNVAISLAAAGSADCTFTNSRLPTLKVTKVLGPSNDPGKFNLLIDSAIAGTGANVGDGGTTGAQPVTVGSHTVGETAGTGTSLTDYVTVIGGDCAADGTITLAYGDNKTCTITNTHKPKLTVTKLLVPSNDPGKFNLLIDSAIAGTGANVGDGGTTGAQLVTVGSHTVGETAGTGTSLTDYVTTIGGDCAANGSITLAAGDNKTCTITNTRKTYKVIVIVCREDDNSLYASNVAFDGSLTTESSISTPPAPATMASLCGITNADLTGASGGNHTASITIP